MVPPKVKDLVEEGSFSKRWSGDDWFWMLNLILVKSQYLNSKHTLFTVCHDVFFQKLPLFDASGASCFRLSRHPCPTFFFWRSSNSSIPKQRQPYLVETESRSSSNRQQVRTAQHRLASWLSAYHASKLSLICACRLRRSINLLKLY